VQTEITGSTVPRRQLGRSMRDLRGHARMTVRAAAQALEWSEGKIWRIETGQTSMRSHDAELMCRIYGADAETTGALAALAKETRSRGWWHSYGDVIPEFFDMYIGLEEVASSFRWYENDLVPGLLQTEAYARALIVAANPGVDTAEIENRVRVRIGRGNLLTRPADPPRFQAVLGEAVLRSPVGGRLVMHDQLKHLVRMMQFEHVGIRVVPFARGGHPGLYSRPFITLRFPEKADGRASEPPTVYVEAFTGSLYLDKPSEVMRYDSAWGDLWACSLGAEESREFIREAAKEMKHE